MKLSEITESFDSKVRGRLIQSTPDLFVVSATIGARDIKFVASRFEEGLEIEPESIWEILFYEQTLTGQGGSLEKTGSGNQMQVFSFILDAIKELIKRYSPEILRFNAENIEPSRIKLYNALIGKIKIPGYTGQSHGSDSIGNAYYSITKDK